MYTGDKLFEIENYRDIPSLIKSADKVTLISSENGVAMHRLEQKRFKKAPDVKIDLAFPIVHGTNCEDGTIA